MTYTYCGVCFIYIIYLASSDAWNQWCIHTNGGFAGSRWGCSETLTSLCFNGCIYKLHLCVTACIVSGVKGTDWYSLKLAGWSDTKVTLVETMEISEGSQSNNVRKPGGGGGGSGVNVSVERVWIFFCEFPPTWHVCDLSSSVDRQLTIACINKCGYC